MARTRSFTAAARELGVAPSVVTKRITQLEEQMGAPLLVRSTRGLALTVNGERCLPRLMRLNAEIEAIFQGPVKDDQRLEAHLRIKAPTTITSLVLGGLLSDFQALHPGVSLDIVLMDRSVNPLEEGFDAVVGARPATYPYVVDVPLCSYPIVVCCAPAYLENRSTPEHPSDLAELDCLTSVLLGTTWQFESAGGAVSVEVHSKFHANDGRVLLEAARRALGIAALPRFLAEEDLRTGRLIALLPNFPLTSFWLKISVPRIKMEKPAVRELVAFLKQRLPVVPAFGGEEN